MAESLKIDDGNQLSGSSGAASGQTFLWDGENRLITVKDATGNVLVSYTYDHASRRIRRATSTSTTLYVYDGWNCVAEYQAINTQLTTINLAKTYTWGLDLSGSLQGAGGVGGLLAVYQIANGQITNTAYPTFDGNGNVSEYLDTTGTVAAHFEYDAFGSVISSTGNIAGFDYRFSTKPQDDVTGWLYYGYRYYDAVAGRWASKDPIEEDGGVNLYGAVHNDSIGRFDSDGRIEMGVDRYGRVWVPGTPPLPAPQPTPTPAPTSGDEAFEQALNTFFGSSTNRTFNMGKNHPWTEDLIKHPHINKVRNEIESRIHKHCTGYQKLPLNQPQPASFTLNKESWETNARYLIRDIFSRTGLTPSRYSMGSFAMTYTISQIDCSKCSASVSFDAKDRLRMGSLTRIPGTNTEIIHDNPNGPSGKYGTVYLHWYWTEKIPY